MLIIYGIQFALSTVWSLGVNRIYYANYPSPDTAIVYWNEADLKRVRMIRYFDEHFNVTKMIDKPSENGNELFEQLEDVQVVFVSGLTAGMRNDIAKYCVLKGKKAYFIPKLGDIVMAGAEYMSMFSEPVTKVQRTQLKTEYLGIKRLMDIVVSLIGLIMVSPIIAATAIAIKVEDGGPVFYRQKRLTLNGRVFSILKFRSMNTNAEKDGVARLASENDKRITRVGKWIRATRIDELPQLINILKGDMSLVGPRPERPEIASEYEKVLPEFRMRLQVKAGLTGMAQVYGRYNTEPYSKLQMDLMYINKLSLETDIKLLFATVKILFMKESTEGIQAGHTTALNDEGDKDNSQMSA
jgi:exopolysaccharide biosynthesis polyprenyl glycosylphosphotransferase